MSSTERIHYKDVTQGGVFFGQIDGVLLLAFVEAAVFQHNQLTGSDFYAIQVVFGQTNRAGQCVFQIVDNRSQGEFFVVFTLGRTTQVGGDHQFGALFQSQLDGRQSRNDTCIGGDLAVFYRYVQVSTDQNAFTRQIQVSHLDNRHIQSSIFSR